MFRKLTKFSFLMLAFFALSANAFANFSIKPAFGEFEHESQETGIFVFTVDPGETINTGVKLINTSGEQMNLAFDSLDATYNEQGSFVVSRPSDEQEGVGAWTEFTDASQNINSFPVAPRSEVRVPVSVVVPENLAPGSYFGSFQVHPAAVANIGDSDVSTGSAVTTRVGKIVQINVRGEEVVDYKWTDFNKAVLGEDGQYAANFVVQNNGNVVVKVLADIVVNDLFGNEVFTTQKEFTALPGTMKDTPVYIENIPSMGLFNVEANVMFTPKSYLENSNVDSTEESRSLSFIVMPLLPVLGGLAVILLIVAYLVHKHLVMKKFKANSEQYKVKKGDTLVELAMKRNVDWKLLAKANKIKSPYFIAPSQVILLPKKNK